MGSVRAVRVIVVGGGIGGLTTALMLHQRGIDVQVYESVRDIQPLGVGINVLPHAMAQLDSLGALERIADLGVRTSELCFFNRHGQRIWREPRGLDAGYPVPQISVHRGRFQLTLLDLVRERLGADAVRTGHHLLAATTDGPRVVVRFLDRSLAGAHDVGAHDVGAHDVEVLDAEVLDEADLVVAADGIHSAVRAAWHPHEGPPKWSGAFMWRAISRSRPFLTGRSMFMAGHKQVKFVAYPIGPVEADGLQTVNWIAELDRSGEERIGRESWNRVGDIADFLPRFADWRFDWLDVPTLIESADAVYEFPMVDRDPLDTWTYGRVTLLGDAAHPMYPVGSNGSSQAILDARALADALAAEPSVEAALARYDSERRPATGRIVMSNRQHGPERVLDMAEERAPGGFADASDVFAPGELEGIAATYKQTAGFTTAQVTTAQVTTAG